MLKKTRQQLSKKLSLKEFVDDEHRNTVDRFWNNFQKMTTLDDQNNNMISILFKDFKLFSFNKISISVLMLLIISFPILRQINFETSDFRLMRNVDVYLSASTLIDNSLDESFFLNSFENDDGDSDDGVAGDM